MGTTRRLIVAGLVVFLGFVIYHGFHSTRWTSYDEPPAGVQMEIVTYACSAPWSSNYVHAPKNLPPYAVAGVPCGDHQTNRVTIAVDVILGVAGLAVTLAWPRRPPEAEPA